MSNLSASITARDDVAVDVASLCGFGAEPFICVRFGEADIAGLSLHLSRKTACILSNKLAVALASPIVNPMKNILDADED
jgi:hypothetical protein